VESRKRKEGKRVESATSCGRVAWE
jgi:hypothetical protein